MLADPGGGEVPAAEAFAEADAVGGDVEVDTRRLGDAVAADEDRPVELGDLFDLLADALVAGVALITGVAAERVEVEETRNLLHLPRVADDEDRADRLPLAALAADLFRQIDDGPEHIEFDRFPERPQVLVSHRLEVFADVDDAEAIDRFGGVVVGRDAVVQHDDVGPRLQQFVGHSVQERVAHALVRRLQFPVEFDDVPVVVVAQLPGERRVLSRDEQPAADEVPFDFVPVERSLGDDEHAVGGQAFDEVAGGLQ